MATGSEISNLCGTAIAAADIALSMPQGTYIATGSYGAVITGQGWLIGFGAALDGVGAAYQSLGPAGQGVAQELGDAICKELGEALFGEQGQKTNSDLDFWECRDAAFSAPQEPGDTGSNHNEGETDISDGFGDGSASIFLEDVLGPDPVVPWRDNFGQQAPIPPAHNNEALTDHDDQKDGDSLQNYYD
jgi:hypothetical protein